VIEAIIQSIISAHDAYRDLYHKAEEARDKYFELLHGSPFDEAKEAHRRLTTGNLMAPSTTAPSLVQVPQIHMACWLKRDPSLQPKLNAPLYFYEAPDGTVYSYNDYNDYNAMGFPSYYKTREDFAKSCGLDVRSVPVIWTLDARDEVEGLCNLRCTPVKDAEAPGPSELPLHVWLERVPTLGLPHIPLFIQVIKRANHTRQVLTYLNEDKAKTDTKVVFGLDKFCKMFKMTRQEIPSLYRVSKRLDKIQSTPELLLPTVQRGAWFTIGSSPHHHYPEFIMLAGNDVVYYSSRIDVLLGNAKTKAIAEFCRDEGFDIKNLPKLWTFSADNHLSTLEFPHLTWRARDPSKHYSLPIYIKVFKNGNIHSYLNLQVIPTCAARTQTIEEFLKEYKLKVEDLALIWDRPGTDVQSTLKALGK